MRRIVLHSGRALLACVLLSLLGCQPSAPASGPTSRPAEPTANPAAAPTTAPATTGGAPAGQPRRGGTLRVGLFRDQTTLDPIYGTSTLAERIVMENVYEGLVRLDDKLAVQPDLAESWEHPDPTTYVFQLRRGVKFHDGTDFNAQAVKANTDVVLDPANKSPWRPSWGPLTSVDVVDDFTIKFTLSAPYEPFLSYMGGDAGRLLVVSPAAIQQYGKDLALHAVGTGPFKLAEWVKGDHLTLQRFDGYWDPSRPYLDQVVIRPILDDVVKLQNLRSGNVDFIDSVPYQEVGRLKQSQDVTVYEGPLGTRIRFIMNTQKEPFNNKALRQAMYYGVDRDALNQTVYSGLAGLAEGGLPPGNWATDPSIPVGKQNLDLARQKLGEGGRPNGFSVPFQVLNAPEQQQIGEILKEQLAPLGINLDIQTVTDAQNRQSAQEHAFTSSWSQWQGRSDPDAFLYPTLHSGDPLNWTSYSNSDVDTWLEQARTSSNRDQRKQLYSQVIRQVVDDAPEFVLAFLPYLSASSKQVQGVVLRPIPLPYFDGVWLSQ